MRIGYGFTQADRPMVTELLTSLDARLETFAADDTDLEISVKDRDRPGQLTTLECWVAGWTRWVATSTEPELRKALVEVRDNLRRQLNDSKTRSEPGNNRRLRATLTDSLEEAE